MPLADTAATPAVTATTVGPLTTASFTPAAGSMLVALVSIGNSSGAATAITGAITDSLSRTWTRANRLNTSGDGCVETWTLNNVAATACTVTLTCTGGTICKGSQLSVRQCTGQSLTQTGAAAPTTSGTIGAISITPTVIGSQLYCVLSRNTASAARTINANSTVILSTQDATNGETYNSAKATALTPSLVAVSVGFTTTGSNTLIAGLEVLPASGTVNNLTAAATASSTTVLTRGIGRKIPASATSTAAGVKAAGKIVTTVGSTYQMPTFGVLEADAAHTAADAAGGVKLAMIELSWASWEPTQGTFDSTYKSSVLSQMAGYQAVGIQVGFVVGLHHNPSWVTSLTNGAYVDQNGVSTGLGGGGPYPNLVFSTQVRAAATAYLNDVVATLGTTGVAYYRLGVGENGECYYPDTNGEQWWAFDAAAQSTGGSLLPAGVGANPLIGWIQGNSTYSGGTVTPTLATAWYNWYAGALINCLEWQISTFRAAGYAGQIQAPLAGGGTGPFIIGFRENLLLAAQTGYDPFFTVNTVAAWHLITPALAAYDANITIDSTSVGGGDGSPANNISQPGDLTVTLANADPWVSAWSAVRWVAYLAALAGCPLIGETANNNVTTTALPTVVNVAQGCGVKALLWLTDDSLYVGGSVAMLAQVAPALAAQTVTPPPWASAAQAIRRVGKPIGATTASGAALRRSVGKVARSAVTTTSTISRGISRKIPATVVSSAATLTRTARLLVAVALVTSSATLRRAITRTVSASATSTGSLLRGVGRAITAAVTSTAQALTSRIVLIQSTVGLSGTNQTFGITFSSNVGAGHLLTLTGGCFNQLLITGVTGGGVWAKAQGVLLNSGGAGSAELWYCLNATGGATTVTVTLSAVPSNNFGQYAIAEFSGTGWTFDTSANTTNGASSVSATTPGLTPATAGELVVSAGSFQNSVSAPGGGWTEIAATLRTGSSGFMDAAYLVDLTTATATTTYTQGSAGQFSTVIGAFKVGSGVLHTLTAAASAVSAAILQRLIGKLAVAPVAATTNQKPRQVVRSFVPGYFYPFTGGSQWGQLDSTPPPNGAGYVVADIASGPGLTVNSDYTTAITNAQAAGWTVLGYVDTNFTVRTTTDVETDITGWQTLYGITSIFFDRADNTAPNIGYYTTLTAFVHANSGISALNWGTAPDPGYLSLTVCDAGLVFENTYPAWQSSPPASYTTAPIAIGMIVYGVPTAAAVAVIAQAAALGADWLDVTDEPDDLFAALPAYFGWELQVFASTAKLTLGVGKTVTASSTSTASVKRGLARTVAAIVTGTAGLVRSLGKKVAATAASTAAAQAVRARVLAALAVVTSTATVLTPRALVRTIAATAASTATLARKVGRTIAATPAATAVVVRGVSRTIAATVTSTGATISTKVRLVAALATVTSTASATKQLAKQLVATVTSSGALARSLGRTIATACTSAANLARSIRRTIATTVSSTGFAIATRVKLVAVVASVTSTASVATRQALVRAFTATATSAAALTRSVGRTVTATASSTPTILRAISRTFVAGCTSTSSTTRRIGRTVLATVASTGFVTAVKVRLVQALAVVTSTAGVSRRVGKTIAASVTSTPSLVRSVAKTVTATVVSAASAVASPIGGLFFVTATALVTSAASVKRSIGRTAAATVTSTAQVRKSIGFVVVASVASVARATKGIAKLIRAVAAAIGNLTSRPVPPPAVQDLDLKLRSPVTMWALGDPHPGWQGRSPMQQWATGDPAQPWTIRAPIDGWDIEETNG